MKIIRDEKLRNGRTKVKHSLLRSGHELPLSDASHETQDRGQRQEHSYQYREHG